jgi:uncharacterized protein
MTFVTGWNGVQSKSYIRCLFLVKLFIFIVLCGLFSTQAIAASFDCQKATTWLEKKVCSNQELSKLDEQLAKAYHDALSNLSPEGQQETKQYQRQWLNGISTYPKAKQKLEFDDKDKYSNSDVRLKFAYEDRIKQLQECLTKFPDRIFRNVYVYNSQVYPYPQIENPCDENEKFWNYIVFKRVHDSPALNAGCPVNLSNKKLISLNYFSWLLEERRELQASDIFDDKTGWRNKLVTFVSQKKNELEAADERTYWDPDIDDLISPSKWEISADGLSFELNTYNFRGTASIIVEWSILDPYLSKNGRFLLGRTTQVSGAATNNITAPETNKVKAPIAPVVALPKTGQTICYDNAGAIIDCKNSGQDGDLQKGVIWPSPRFTDNGNLTVTDSLTGLMWTKDGNAPGPAGCIQTKSKNWQQARDYISCINANKYLGYNDWRLPNRKELRSLVNYGEANSVTWLNTQGFTNVQSYYWSSTAFAYDDRNGSVWTVFMHNGMVHNHFMSSNSSVWPVRSGKAGIINLPKSGQMVCYGERMAVIDCKKTGQDGDLQKGVTWPNPRFTDNGDLTITDNLTGLMWTRGGSAPGPASCKGSSLKNWQQALDYAACLNTNNYLGHNDWRVPNINELESLVHAGQAGPSDWLSSQGFTNVKSTYWSSTTFTNSKNRALTVGMHIGGMEGETKERQIYVWPVRSGN